MAKQTKTNAMRMLDAQKIAYKEHYYTDSGAVAGVDVAKELGEDPAFVFKTLVTVGKSGQHYVFVVPVEKELDLKKAASAVGEKSIAMVKSKELLPLTGYIHGGCSPVGMKKLFRTTVDKSAEGLERMFCSGGKIGFQIELVPMDLRKAVPFEFADITAE